MRFRARGATGRTQSHDSVGTLRVAANQRRKVAIVTLRHPHSINDIRNAIRELSTRAALARKEGRAADADELERRVAGYRDELGERP